MLSRYSSEELGLLEAAFLNAVTTRLDVGHVLRDALELQTVFRDLSVSLSPREAQVLFDFMDRDGNAAVDFHGGDVAQRITSQYFMEAAQARYSDLRGADLTGANLSGAELSGITSGLIRITSGPITETPTLPVSYSLVNGYIVGSVFQENIIYKI